MRSNGSTSDGGSRQSNRCRTRERLWTTLSLVTALLALATAAIGLVEVMQTKRQSREAVVTADAASRDAREALDRSALMVIAASTTIEDPVEGQEITEAAYSKMHGKLYAELPSGYALRVLAHEGYNYFLMNPPTQVAGPGNEWTQDNVCMATPGSWQLSVCLADKNALAWFDDRVRRGDWGGFPTLPLGASILARVNVTRADEIPARPQAQGATTQTAATTAQAPVSVAPTVELVIDRPKEGEAITALPYDGMRGTLVGELPPGSSLRVLVRDSYNYFLMNPPVQFDKATGEWSQTNVRLSTPGRWQLCVCLADEQAASWLDGRVRRSDWSGFSALPDGLVVLRAVNVTKE